jgi:hypothetical protein
VLLRIGVKADHLDPKTTTSFSPLDAINAVPVALKCQLQQVYPVLLSGIIARAYCCKNPFFKLNILFVVF